MKSLHYLPNFITLTNLSCGCLGIVWAFQDHMSLAVYMIWLAAILDFTDGLLARLIGVSSELGKQLDSLADLVSFGLLPAVVVFKLFSQFHPTVWAYAAFLIVVFSALRLAKFNIDPDQGTDFIGLPTPANALLISSFPSIIEQNSAFLRPGLEFPLLWVAVITVLSYLLVSKIKLFGLKFKNFGWAENKFRLIFIALSVVSLFLWHLTALPLIMAMYLLLSVLRQYRWGLKR